MSTTYVELESLTLEQIQAKMREIAAERPDFVYTAPNGESCMYVWVNDEDGELHGDCLVGCALVALGVDPETLVTAPVAEDLLRPCTGNRRVRIWIQKAQDTQDTEVHWGRTLELADAHFETLA